MKLKCNRERPCSNCVTRGVTCERAAGGPIPSPRVQQQPSSPTHTDHDILARLQRLENIVLRHSDVDESRREFVAGSHSAPAPPTHISEGEGDSRWLESVGTREASVISGLSNMASFTITPIQQAVPAITPRHTSGSGATTASAVMKVWLPPKDEALWLLERYTKYIAYLHHVLHLPSVRLLLDDAYKQLSLGLNVEPGHVTLLLTVFASTAYMLELNTADSIFLSQTHAMNCAITWTKTALDALENSRRNTQGSMEDVQATIILSFIIFNIEGFSSRFRTLSSSALVMGRDLALHQIDADTGTKNESPVQLEIKRRVWWHMVSTDWLLALSAGPQEGTYLIHPKHMRVNHPRNINDVDLEHPDPEYNLPLSEPTTMSYYMLRIRLAEITRSIVDVLPSSPPDWGTVDYDIVISLDRKFDDFLHDMPLFLRHDETSREQSREIDRRYPQTIFQRYIIASTFHSRRFKLNQPFLARMSLDRRYEYSRNVCLQSARSIINMNKFLQQDTGFLSSVHVRLATLLSIFYLAIAVLVIDICINKDDDNEGQRQEVMDACCVLKQAEATSPVAGRFLRSLTDMLQKYQIQVAPDLITRPDAPGNISGSYTSDLCTSEMQESVLSPDNLDQGTGNVDGMLQDFIDLGSSGVVTDWDDLFSALDARIL
ncbi:hypothetical protein BBP40_006968 [Aspergillus hancockii]|nr:hypothetical protein BBP40_006968 [Aspergillus hancockii]